MCNRTLATASVQVRNGSGANPLNLTAVSRPVLGSTWLADLDCTGFGSGLAVLSVRRHADPGTWSPMGEVLIDGTLLHGTAVAQAGTMRRLGWPIPLDLSLCGLQAHVQGLCRSASSGAGKTAAVRAQLSNALDLILGF